MIDKKYQNKGLGNKSFEELINYIKQKESEKKIEISTANPIAKNLYQKHGFKLINNAKAKRFYRKYKEDLLTLL